MFFSEFSYLEKTQGFQSYEKWKWNGRVKAYLSNTIEINKVCTLDVRTEFKQGVQNKKISWWAIKG